MLTLINFSFGQILVWICAWNCEKSLAGGDLDIGNDLC